MKFLFAKNFKDKRGGGAYHDFLSETFVSQYRNTLWGSPSVFEKLSITEKFQGSEGGKWGSIPIFHWKFVFSQYRKTS